MCIRDRTLGWGGSRAAPPQREDGDMAMIKKALLVRGGNRSEKLAPQAAARGSRGTHPWWFLAPAFAVMAIFFLTPTIYNFVYAFTDWSSFKSSISAVGFDNFAALLHNGSLLTSLRVTLVYAVLVAVFQN